MNAPRHTRVIAALIQAQGRWLNSEALAAQLGIGRPQVAAAISEARQQGGVTIETHKFRGVGWRIAPAGEAPVAAVGPGPAIEQAAAKMGEIAAPIIVAAVTAINGAGPDSGLSARAAAMLARLQSAGGDYVDGRSLAAAIGAQIDQLSVYALELRRKMPALRVEGRRGSGYRIGPLAPADAPPARVRRTNAAGNNTRRPIELLETLLPATAEKLRSVALEAGETLTETLFRVIEYGIEVHHDLIREGQHPLQLRRAA